MKRVVLFFNLSLNFLFASSKVNNFVDINEKFRLYNRNLQNVSKIYITELENYYERVITTFETYPEMKPYVEIIPKVVEGYKSSNFPYFDDIKSCDDLKVRNSSTFLIQNEYRIAYFDEQIWAWNKLQWIDWIQNIRNRIDMEVNETQKLERLKFVQLYNADNVRKLLFKTVKRLKWQLFGQFRRGLLLEALHCFKNTYYWLIIIIFNIAF